MSLGSWEELELDPLCYHHQDGVSEAEERTGPHVDPARGSQPLPRVLPEWFGGPQSREVPLSLMSLLCGNQG